MMEAVAIIATAPEAYRNRDSDFPYRHDSDFFTSQVLLNRNPYSSFRSRNSHVSHLF
jgi:hypothetical protein